MRRTKTGAKNSRGWHPLVTEVLATLTRPVGGPTVDEQISFGMWLSVLPEQERGVAAQQLTEVVKKLCAAHEDVFARLLQSILVFATQQESMPHAAKRVRLKVEPA
jgi:hypothetical protein